MFLCNKCSLSLYRWSINSDCYVHCCDLGILARLMYSKTHTVSNFELFGWYVISLGLPVSTGLLIKQNEVESKM